MLPPSLVRHKVPVHHEAVLLLVQDDERRVEQREHREHQHDPGRKRGRPDGFLLRVRRLGPAAAATAAGAVHWGRTGEAG